MALHFDTTGITPSFTTSPFDADKWHPVTNALVFATMAIGIREITKANTEEVFYRIAVLQHFDGPYIVYIDPIDGTRVEMPITLGDVENHIGLKTNASTLTKAQFNKRSLEILERHSAYKAVGTSAHDKVARQFERHQIADRMKVA